MIGIHFSITFHGPFRVQTGSAAEGTDITVDRLNPLPATSIKGLLRAEARDRLGIRPALVDEIFGRSTSGPDGPRRSESGAWWFSDASLEEMTVDVTARVAVDERGRAREGMLVFGEQVWASAGRFIAEPLRRLDDADYMRHALILRAAARSVSSLGSDRRRGLGWVTITDDRPWVDANSRALIDLRDAS